MHFHLYSRFFKRNCVPPSRIRHTTPHFNAKTKRSTSSRRITDHRFSSLPEGNLQNSARALTSVTMPRCLCAFCIPITVHAAAARIWKVWKSFGRTREGKSGWISVSAGGGETKGRNSAPSVNRPSRILRPVNSSKLVDARSSTRFLERWFLLIVKDFSLRTGTDKPMEIRQFSLCPGPV